MSAQPASSFTEANGLRLHTLTWRPESGGGRPVLLCHATGFMARIWQPIAERLSDAGYTAIAFDARGHGDSDKPEATWENYDWHRLADDLRAFLDANGLRGIPFVGHSMGAGIALFVAAHHPEYFSRMAAIEPIVMPGDIQPDEERRDQMAEGARRRRATFASVEDIVAHYRGRGAFERWPEEMLRLYAEYGSFPAEDGQVRLKCSGEIEGEVFASSGTLNTWDVLPSIEVPTLVLRGEHTEPFVGMVAGQVAGRIPGSGLVTMPGLGHLAPMEDPRAVAREVLAFLAG